MVIKSKAVISVGIDIGTSSVKAVKVLIKETEIELSGFGVCRMKNPESHQDIIECIKKTAQDAGLEEKLVNIAALGNAVIVRYLILPKMTKEELKNAIKFEAEKYVPFNMEDVIFDYQILEDNLEDNKMRLLLVVAKKDYINNRLKLMEEAGFGTKIIDVDSFALANAFFKNFNVDKNKTIAFISIGAKFTDINIFRGVLPYFTRTIELGGEDITKMISSKLNLSYDQANELKLNFAGRELEVYESIKTVITNLVDEVRLSFGYYENQFGKDIDEVYISGGASNLAGFKEHLAKLLGFELKTWEAVRALKISDSIDKDKFESLKSELGVAIGLAIRE